MLNYLKRKKIKIGILGGSFDPPHKGHLAITNIAIKKLNLDLVIWLLTKKNPFKKKPYFSIKKRIKLSKTITKKRERKINIEYLDNIIDSSHTYDLLNFIKKFNSNLNIFFLMGADSFVNFHKWYKWKKIPKIAKIIIFDRETYSITAMNSIASKKLKKKEWDFIQFKKINFSSSKIKKI